MLAADFGNHGPPGCQLEQGAKAGQRREARRQLG